MYQPIIDKAEDAKAFGRDLMRLAADQEEQDKALGALFRAVIFGLTGNKKPA